MIREVIQVPDERLRVKCEKVGVFDESLQQLVDDLIHTMRHGARAAVGLAAPQIGVPLRVFVMETVLAGGRPKIYTCINPEIVASSGGVVLAEGCLSFPEEQFVKVERSAVVRLRYLDRRGIQYETRLEGLLAVCAQHELDHLDGTLMTDRGEIQERTP